MWAAAILLVVVYFFPLWRISLQAPQYPDGLGIDIWIYKITGRSPHDLQNINGLNHYIGMRAIEPDSIPDYLALVGDAADGFPGLPGWGAKSSATLLARYRHLENIPLHPAQWDVAVRGAEKLATTLRLQMGEALLYRFLAQLRTDVPLPDSLRDLEWRGVPRNTFETFCDELGFDRLKTRPERWQD